MNTDNTSSAIEPNPDVVPEDMRDPSEDRWLSMPLWVRTLVILASAGGVLMAIGYIFSIFPLLDLTYYFLLMAAFLPVVYLLLPAWKGEKGVTWASYAPAIAIAVLCLIMAYFARQLVFGTWVPVREDWQLVVAVGLYLLILEGARRSGGMVFLVIVLVLSLYPVYAFYMPGILWGPPTSFARTVAFNVFSNDAMLGVVTRVVAETLIGFVGAGLLTFAQGLGVVFGANIGTTFTGWIVTTIGFKLDLGGLALPLLVIGMLGAVALERSRQAWGSALLLLGLGLLLYGLGFMKESVEAFAGSLDLSGLTGTHPYWFFVTGFVFAAIIQSSSATMMITLSGLNAGVIDLVSAGAIAIGADLGTTSTLMLGSLRGNAAAKQVALAHLLYNRLPLAKEIQLTEADKAAED